MPAFTTLDLVCWALRGALVAAGWVLGRLAGLLVRAFARRPYMAVIVLLLFLGAALL